MLVIKLAADLEGDVRSLHSNEAHVTPSAGGDDPPEMQDIWLEPRVGHHFAFGGG